MSLLNLSGISFRYPSTGYLFRDATFAIEPGECLAVVGPNGAGKSTLLRILAGEIDPSDGSIARRKGLRTAHVLQQTSATDANGSLFDFVFSARGDLAALRDNPAEYETAGGYAAEGEIGRILGGLGFSRAEHELPLARLSGGQRTRASLARGLHTAADIILLDEPTNHLDITARLWLEKHLSKLDRACVLVSHDRMLLRQAATRILEIERSRVMVFEARYDEYRVKRALLERQAREAYEARERRKAAAEQAAERRSRLAVRVGTAPPGIRSSRDFYGRKAAKVARTARILSERISHEPEIAKPWEEQRIPTLTFGNVRRSGDIALTVTGIAKSYPQKPLFANLDFYAARGDRIAIAGANGSGKTTLLRILLGIERPDAGSVGFGANVQAGYFAQGTEDLDPRSTALDVCGSDTLARTLLACLKLRPDRVNSRVAELSAGERVKIALVRLLVSGANLLLLDEPTNHLEIEAQEALEQALAQFPGTLIVISHDRSFLNGLGPTLRVVEVQ